MARQLIRLAEAEDRSGAAFAQTLLRDNLLRLEPPQRDFPAAFGSLAEPALLAAASRHFGASLVDLGQKPADITLIQKLGLGLCQRFHLLPWQRVGATTLIATAQPQYFAKLRPTLEAELGPVAMVLAPAAQIETAMLAAYGPRIATLAETQVALTESCRDWGGRRVILGALALLLGLVVLLLYAAVPLCLGLLALALLATFLSTALKLACAIAGLRHLPEQPADVLSGPLPTITLIVGLYREGDIAPRLVRRLSKLDYPRELLEVLLAVEAEDQITQTALRGLELPSWMRMVLVPDGRVKTKPRALNVALAQCRGRIVGVYDAEDAPASDQLHQVVAGFQRAAPEVACLQGKLDFYNPKTNWIARSFTLEYATWFRVFLPGVARLGLAVPLGGTTLFFRRDILEALGGWDAWNVTEDADLGLRLARYGYRTEIIDTVTWEEANCRSFTWVKQRSRWIKGYMMTWILNMRHPYRLWRQIGTRAYLGFQVMFLGAILQGLLAPILWSFWLMAIGIAHPLTAAMPDLALPVMIGLFIGSAAVDFTLGIVAIRRSGQKISMFWVFTQHLYHPLATIAGYKALWELVVCPFYWDKTSHGIFDQTAEAP